MNTKATVNRHVIVKAQYPSCTIIPLPYPYEFALKVKMATVVQRYYGCKQFNIRIVCNGISIVQICIIRKASVLIKN